MADTVAEFRSAIDDLSVSAFGDLNRLLTSLSASDGVTVRNDLIATMPDLMGPYLAASGELSATWYEELRASALGGTYYATSSGDVNRAQMDALVRWGVRPLFGQSDATVLSLIGGGVQRMISGAARDTIDSNARRDIVSTSWSRIARPDACAFCRMLAGRGAVYRSKDAAGLTLSQSVHTGSVASHYHDFCRCTAKPTFYRIGVHRDPTTGKEQRALVPIPD